MLRHGTRSLYQRVDSLVSANSQSLLVNLPKVVFGLWSLVTNPVTKISVGELTSGVVELTKAEGEVSGSPRHFYWVALIIWSLKPL